MPTPPSHRSLIRALLVALVLPLSAAAQTPVTAPINVAPDPSKGFCDAKFLPLTDANVQVAFAETAAREGLIAHFRKMGRYGVGEAIVRAIEAGTPERKHLAVGYRINPMMPFAVLSMGRDGSMVGPLVRIRYPEVKDDENLLTLHAASALAFTVLGQDYYLLRDSCQLAIPHTSLLDRPAPKELSVSLQPAATTKQAATGKTKKPAEPTTTEKK